MKARNTRFQDWPLAVTLTVSITILIVGIVLAITWITLRREQAAFQEDLQQQAELLLSAIGGAAADSLYADDVDEINDLMKGLGRREVLIFGRAYDAEGRVLSDSINASKRFDFSIDPFGQQILESEGVVYDWQPDQLIAGQAVTAGSQVLGAIGVSISTATLEAKTTAIRNQGIAIAIGAIVIGIIFAIVLSRFITRPLDELVETTQQMASGDMSVRTTVRGHNEIGTLATSFNQLANQLEQNISILEQRTQALNTNVEISRQISSILNIDNLINGIVTRIQHASNYYHVHIYIVDELTNDLLMAGGTGEAGTALLVGGHKVSQGEGLVGRAANTKETVLVSNVAEEEGWLPNPLLPDTQAEIAVPIVIGDQVLGVLDVQQNEADTLSEVDTQLLELVANQVAIAIRNARMYESSQTQARRETIANSIGQRLQTAADIESVLQIAAQELGKAFNSQRATVQLGTTELDDNGHQETITV